MTMAEMLTVVAIIVILAGVAFIALFNYQRSLAQLERDNIAKEIFIAAQNHLTMAKGEAYLGVGVENKTAGESSADRTARLLKETGYKDDNETKSDVRYIVVDGGQLQADNSNNNSIQGGSMFDLMLPFGSIDETVRGGGSYIIRYEKESGTILDVFYCSTSGSPSKYNHTLSSSDYVAVKALRDGVDNNGKKIDHKSDRRTWTDGAVLGWYGGENAGKYSNIMRKPVVKVINTSKLIVRVEDDNAVNGKKEGTQMRLIIRGEESGAGKYFNLDYNNDYSTKEVPVSALKTKTIGVHTVVLDDITTAGKRFATQFYKTSENIDKSVDSEFIPGENLIIKAIAFNNNVPSNIEFSNEVITNSLFESAVGNTDGVVETAAISNIRHLENLDNAVSGFAPDTKTEDSKVRINKVIQTDNIYWNGTGIKSFISELKKYDSNVTDARIFIYETTPINVRNCTVMGSFKPIWIDFGTISEFIYDGQNHSIAEINMKGVNTTSVIGVVNELAPLLGFNNAGLFETYGSGTIKNLELVNFSVEGSGNIGALAGGTNNTTIENVLVRNTVKSNNTYTVRSDDNFDNDGTTDNKEPNIDAGGSANAGGLVGYMDGGSVQYSAAAIYVNGATAGGLIGEAASAAIKGCYSGGHTEYGEYYKHTIKDNKIEKTPLYNVKGTTAAGGLIGKESGSTINSSYSTCSVFAGTDDGVAGGLIGYTDSGTINNCYSAGLVATSKEENANTDEKKKGLSYDNAFIGGGSPEVSTGNKYLSIINEYTIGSTVNYKKPGPNNVSVAAVDENTSEFISFMTMSAVGLPYDTGSQTVSLGDSQYRSLSTYHGNKYAYNTVDQLEDDSFPNDGDYYVNGRHYGDWPAPEIFFINN